MTILIESLANILKNTANPPIGNAKKELITEIRTVIPTPFKIKGSAFIKMLKSSSYIII
jgi:hypothetical protein